MKVSVGVENVHKYYKKDKIRGWAGGFYGHCEKGPMNAMQYSYALCMEMNESYEINYVWIKKYQIIKYFQFNLKLHLELTENVKCPFVIADSHTSF